MPGRTSRWARRSPGRTDTAVDDLVGFFVNTIVVRTDTGGDPTFGELAGRVRGRVLDAIEHQDLPFEAVVETLRPPRVRGRNPLFQAMVGHIDATGAQDGALGLAGDVRLAPGAAAKFDLNIVFAETDGGLALNVEYATDRFDAATAERLTERLAGLLDQVAADPSLRLGTIDVLLPPSTSASTTPRMTFRRARCARASRRGSPRCPARSRSSRPTRR